MENRLTVFEDFVKVFEMVHNHVAVLLKNGERNKQVETARIVICP